MIVPLSLERFRFLPLFYLILFFPPKPRVNIDKRFSVYYIFLKWFSLCKRDAMTITPSYSDRPRNLLFRTISFWIIQNHSQSAAEYFFPPSAYKSVFSSSKQWICKRNSSIFPGISVQNMKFGIWYITSYASCLNVLWRFRWLFH